VPDGPDAEELARTQIEQDFLRANSEPLGGKPIVDAIRDETRFELLDDGGFVFTSVDELPSGVRFRYRAVIDGNPTRVTGLVISAPEGIDSSVLRAIHPSRMVRTVGKAAEGALRRFIETTDHPQAVEARRRLAADTRAETRGRPRLSDEFLLGIAQEYLHLQDVLQGTGKSVMQELADRRFASSVKTVEMWVRRAAKSEFLTAAVKGRAGRLPGPRYQSPDNKKE
jgi:hypothetical protein